MPPITDIKAEGSSQLITSHAEFYLPNDFLRNSQNKHKYALCGPQQHQKDPLKTLNDSQQKHNHFMDKLKMEG